MKLIDAALYYAARGYPVFPCVPGYKRPATENGYKDATTDPVEIREWWTANPNANIGIATEGMLVVDVDVKKGPNAWFEEYSDQLDSIAVSETAHGGRHYLFRQPNGRPYRNTTSRIASDVDTRATGGYIVAPPSVLVPDAEIEQDGGTYQWAKGKRLKMSMDELSPPPEFVLSALENGKPRGKTKSKNYKVTEGERNDYLFRFACKNNDKANLTELVKQENEKRCDPPLDEAEVRKIVESALNYPSPDKKPTATSQLIEIAQAAPLWHDAEPTPFCSITNDGHVEHWPLRSRAFRQWLACEYYNDQGKPPSSNQLNDALTCIEGIALFEGEEHPIHLRVAEYEGRIYVDLCDAEWRCVEIDASGWRIISDPPVKFRRMRAMQPLPMPERGGDVLDLQRFLNIRRKDWPLVGAWLIASLRPRGPYPILTLFGEQGNAKSTAARVLKELVDPNSAPLRSPPKEPRDLAIAANNGHVIALDNLSWIPLWMSDALCRLATGGGFSTRQLYSDDEERIFEATRPVIITSIEEVVIRGDLMDRALLVELPKIDEKNRRTEKQFKREFDKAKPRIFGALLDAVSEALRQLPDVRLPVLPRMADFATWAVAGEEALGLEKGRFIEAYTRNRRDANQSVLESSAIVEYLVKVAEDSSAWTEVEGWEGTASALLCKMERMAPDSVKTKSRGWPTSARALSGQIRRLAPNLRASGITVEFYRSGRGNKRAPKIFLSKSD